MYLAGLSYAGILVIKSIYSCIILVSVLDYGAGVWGYWKQTKCDAVQIRAMCCFLGVPLCGDVGREPREVQHKNDMS